MIIDPMMRPTELCSAVGWQADGWDIAPGCEFAEIEPPENGDDVIRCLLAIGLASVGLQAGVPATRGEFERVIGPPPPGKMWDLDRPFSLKLKQGMSTCMAVVVGWARMAGFWTGLYKTGIGTSELEGAARKVSAWETPRSGAKPGPGSLIVFGENPSETHSEMVVTRDDANGVIYAIGGGQVGAKGLQAIFARRRPFIEEPKRQFVGHRMVLGWVEPALMPRPPGARCLVPANWRQIPV